MKFHQTGICISFLRPQLLMAILIQRQKLFNLMKMIKNCQKVTGNQQPLITFRKKNQIEQLQKKQNKKEPMKNGQKIRQRKQMKQLQKMKNIYQLRTKSRGQRLLRKLKEKWQRLLQQRSWKDNQPNWKHRIKHLLRKEL